MAFAVAMVRGVLFLGCWSVGFEPAGVCAMKKSWAFILTKIPRGHAAEIVFWSGHCVSLRRRMAARPAVCPGSGDRAGLAAFAEACADRRLWPPKPWRRRLGPPSSRWAADHRAAAVRRATGSPPGGRRHLVYAAGPAGPPYLVPGTMRPTTSARETILNYPAVVVQGWGQGRGEASGRPTDGRRKAIHFRETVRGWKAKPSHGRRPAPPSSTRRDRRPDT